MKTLSVHTAVIVIFAMALVVICSNPQHEQQEMPIDPEYLGDEGTLPELDDPMGPADDPLTLPGGTATDSTKQPETVNDGRLTKAEILRRLRENRHGHNGPRQHDAYGTGGRFGRSLKYKAKDVHV